MTAVATPRATRRFPRRIGSLRPLEAPSQPRSFVHRWGWLLLLAATYYLKYQEFLPHSAILQGYEEHVSPEQSIELRQRCLSLLTTDDSAQVTQGLEIGFRLVGWACAEAHISPLKPSEFDLEQMKRKGLA